MRNEIRSTICDARRKSGIIGCFATVSIWINGSFSETGAFGADDFEIPEWDQVGYITS